MSIAGNQRAAWRIIASAEQKGKTTGNKQQALYEKKENLESEVANMKFDAGASEDPFVKVKGLITRLIDRLQTEMSHVSYCDEGTSMAAEKEDLEDDTAKHSSPLETAVPNSTEFANEGHLDKICDQLCDAVPDACLACDTKCKVANETCVKDNMSMVTGEITVTGKHETVVRDVIHRQTDQVIDVPVVLIFRVPQLRVMEQTVETLKSQRFEEESTLLADNKLPNDSDSLELFTETLPSPIMMQIQSDETEVIRRARAVVRNSSSSSRDVRKVIPMTEDVVLV